MKLSDNLKYWRAERPDEWKMDEFIRKAGKLIRNMWEERVNEEINS